MNRLAENLVGKKWCELDTNTQEMILNTANIYKDDNANGDGCILDFGVYSIDVYKMVQPNPEYDEYEFLIDDNSTIRQTIDWDDYEVKTNQ